MTDNTEQKQYKPVIDVKQTHKNLQGKFDPLSGSCSQEFRNWLDSPQCLMLAGLGVYIEVYVHTKASPSDIMEQIINSMHRIQKAVFEGRTEK